MTNSGEPWNTAFMEKSALRLQPSFNCMCGFAKADPVSVATAWEIAKGMSACLMVMTMTCELVWPLSFSVALPCETGCSFPSRVTVTTPRLTPAGLRTEIS